MDTSRWDYWKDRYVVVNGTAYDKGTPEDVVKILEKALHEHRQCRLVLHLGNSKTGKTWGDKCTGYIGRSTGSIKVMLSVHNRRSLGGDAVSTRNIVKIETARGKYRLWQHPKYHEGGE